MIWAAIYPQSDYKLRVPTNDEFASQHLLEGYISNYGGPRETRMKQLELWKL